MKNKNNFILITQTKITHFYNKTKFYLIIIKICKEIFKY